MNMVDLRRTQRRGIACAAVAAFACMAVMPAQAEVANPNLVPADSAYIFSIPDSGAFWNAWQANGLYSAFNKVKDMPEVKEKTADFEKELSIIESSLGFQIDGATLSKTFSSVDIYVEAGNAKDVNPVAIFKVADADKVTKLLDLAEKAAVKAAESNDDGTTETKTADDATSAVIATDYNGVQIKEFKGQAEDSKTFLYARTGELLIASGNEDALKKAIDRTKAETPGADVFANSENYKKIDAALAKEKGEVYVYTNHEAVNNMNSSDVPAAVKGPLQSLIDNVAPVTFSGSSAKIAPKEISAYSHGLLKDGISSDSLVLQNKGDKPLEIASYVPETTVMGIATGLVDAESLAKLVSGFVEESGKGDDLSDKVKSAETGMGFSMKNDLVPAMGNELAFSISNVEFGGLIPTIDATIIVGVKDKAKMAKVTSGIERFATNAMAAQADDSETSGPAFISEDVEGQTIKYVEVKAIPGLSPGYVLSDNYLFIGSTKSALEGALKAKSSGKNLATGSVLSGLGHGVSGNANTVSYMSVSKILDIAKKVTQMIPAAREAGQYIDAVSVIDASGSSSRVEGDALVTRNVLKLK